MQNTIERLKEQATANIAEGQPLDTYGVISSPWGFDSVGIMVTNGEALQISEILERASYPPIVQAALSCLEIMRTEEGIDNWAGVSITGMLRTYDNRPEKIEGGWRLNIGYSRQVFSMPVFGIESDTAATLLFERTPDGWKWAFAENHNPAQ